MQKPIRKPSKGKMAPRLERKARGAYTPTQPRLLENRWAVNIGTESKPRLKSRLDSLLRNPKKRIAERKYFAARLDADLEVLHAFNSSGERRKPLNETLKRLTEVFTAEASPHADVYSVGREILNIKFNAWLPRILNLADTVMVHGTREEQASQSALFDAVIKYISSPPGKELELSHSKSMRMKKKREERPEVYAKAKQLRKETKKEQKRRNSERKVRSIVFLKKTFFDSLQGGLRELAKAQERLKDKASPMNPNLTRLYHWLLRSQIDLIFERIDEFKATPVFRGISVDERRQISDTVHACNLVLLEYSLKLIRKPPTK
ncbi:MAG: hypothetical protein Q7S92_01025 [Candidatus Diapherotrites archaeon]|nr:hypothetical protein [Candidatus Diapherotrites archaeon]